MTYESFTIYPLEIQGITAASDQKINEIKAFAIEKIAYSGDTADLQPILPYFVYYHFLENLITNTSASVGETAQIRTESVQSTFKMCKNWNEGVRLLAELCAEKNEIANPVYLSLRSML